MLTKYELARANDHSLLKPQLTYDEIRKGIEFAKEWKCRTVCVNNNSIQSYFRMRC